MSNPARRSTELDVKADGNGNIQALCMACDSAECNFTPRVMERRPVGDYDILLDIKYCGVCHSDLHTAANHLKGIQQTKYACCPGHELAGIVSQVGAKVSKVVVGQQVGVGCLVDSCQSCKACLSGQEQKCSRSVGTYNSPDKNGRAYSPVGYTLGGYTDKFVVDENFAVIIPDGYPLEYAGPVMCAGITMYEPMQKHNIKAGSRVGIVGLGGLGQMGVRLAKALGAEVSVISRSAAKEGFAKECGATSFIVSSDPKAVKAHAGTLDLIINTIPSYHDYTAYHSLLKKKGGKQVLLGLHAGFAGALVANAVTMGKSRVTSSMIGGIKATQEVMDLCSKHDIKVNIKVVPVEELNSIYELLDGNNDEGIRYVLDIAGTLNADAEARCTAPPPKLTLNPQGQISVPAAIKEALWLLFTCKWV